jgi:hypothetical protein
MKIFLDGELVARLKPGQVVSLPVQAGDHTVTARMDWYQSRLVLVHVIQGEKRTVYVKFPMASIGKLFSGRDAIDIDERRRSASD